MVAHACVTSIWEETEGLPQVQDQSDVQTKTQSQ